jgi:hypothetical protein
MSIDGAIKPMSEKSASEDASHRCKPMTARIASFATTSKESRIALVAAQTSHPYSPEL